MENGALFAARDPDIDLLLSFQVGHEHINSFSGSHSGLFDLNKILAFFWQFQLVGIEIKLFEYICVIAAVHSPILASSMFCRRVAMILSAPSCRAPAVSYSSFASAWADARAIAFCVDHHRVIEFGQ